METLETTSMTEKIINGLKKAAVELEEFRLQSALGKAEVKGAYEEAKKKFNKYLHETKLKIDDMEGVAKETAVQLKTALEELQVQLALGKADSKDIFEEQRKKIEKSLNSLESFLNKNKITDEQYAKLRLEIKKFNIKLGILKLYYELNKLSVTDDLRKKERTFSKKISTIKKRLLKKEKEAERKWGHFQNEVLDAYSHLKKAFIR